MLTRKRVAELMDDPKLDPISHVQALRGLTTLNSISMSARTLWKPIKDLAKKSAQPLKVLDIATGGGDIPIALWKMAQKHKFKMEFAGIDINSIAIEYAKACANKVNAPIKFKVLDAFGEQLPNEFDVLITSLFTHHLDPPSVIALLKKMSETAGKMVLVNDLVRSDLSLAAVWLATRIFSNSPIVQYDGPASVKASFTMDEMQSMAIQAGLNNIELKSCAPCRQLLIWRKE